MQITFALIAALVSVASVTAAPAGCSPSYDGTFEITAINITMPAKRSLEKRAALILTLDNGILKDNLGRTGYIAANNQFQFDNPIQAGALITSGWSACSNGSLALGDSAVFYQCLSGRPDGTQFANLYNEKVFEATCSSALIGIMDGSSGSGVVSQQPDGQPTAASGGATVTQISDGQIQASSALHITQITDGQIQAPTGNPISQISDGQIQAPTGNPISQISDGQIQAPTGKPISQISDGQVQAPTGNPISQISDGQIQAPTGNPISQISDGQVQAPTGNPISQISDGQIQAPTGAPISQISDGQIQAPTGAPITQISDGQVQAPTSVAGAAISQITDGQIQAPTDIGPLNASSSVIPFTGSGNSLKAGIVAVFFGILAVALL